MNKIYADEKVRTGGKYSRKNRNIRNQSLKKK